MNSSQYFYLCLMSVRSEVTQEAGKLKCENSMHTSEKTNLLPGRAEQGSWEDQVQKLVGYFRED